MSTRFLPENLRMELGIDGRIILEWIFSKVGCEFKQDLTGSGKGAQ
jgi:hypothetical protein